MEENKKDIVEKLEILMKATRAGCYVGTLKLSEDEKSVEIIFDSGFSRKVNVEMDSGIEIIRDVLKAF